MSVPVSKTAIMRALWKESYFDKLKEVHLPSWYIIDIRRQDFNGRKTGNVVPLIQFPLHKFESLVPKFLAKNKNISSSTSCWLNIKLNKIKQHFPCLQLQTTLYAILQLTHFSSVWGCKISFFWHRYINECL